VVIHPPIETKNITTREQEIQLMNTVREIISRSYVEPA
jgi:hypothetical protein